MNKVPLERRAPDSPWCFAVTSVADLPTHVNFLATQVWPSARMAAIALQKHLDQKWRVCEFGCGPGLPSLTSAKLGALQTIATDLDSFSLELVQAAAREQHLDSLQTRQFDLTWANEPLPMADLYILSDVFESSAVARGAALHTIRALDAGARVWVFAQSDRAQREAYIDALRQSYNPTLTWSSFSDYPSDEQRLWLCEVDETIVPYG